MAGDGDRGTVLVVDDEPLMALLIRRVLVAKGYGVVSAVAVDDALARVGDTTDLVLVILDVELPRLRGPELAERMRAARPDLAILFMSAHSHDWLVHIGRLPPTARLLEKPFTDAKLVAAVGDAVGRTAGGESRPGSPRVRVGESEASG